LQYRLLHGNNLAARSKVTPGGETFNALEAGRAGAPYNRSELRNPPITIKCECGETREVPYGDRWRCEACERSWDTQQIPAEEYEDLLRRIRRHELEALAMTALAAAIMIPLILVVSSTFILLVPPLMAAWLFLILPFWRRRYRRTARGGPRWQLHPE
jgi:hypothetical protein